MSPNNQDAHHQTAERLLRLTGCNLYPCIRSLSKVNLSNNYSLSQLPEWLCLLPHLTLLNLSHLPHLTSLTPHLSRCRYLCVLTVDTETLLSPPPEVSQRGTRAILAFLRCKLRGCLPYRHIKLVLMGDSGTGKTSVFNRLLGQKPGSDPARPSMDVASFTWRQRQRGSDAAKITFHVIDFSGSKSHQCVHRCFLTYRSIYLVLWNVTEGKDGLRSTLPWLRSIQACVPGSPVIVIATHFDLRPGLTVETILSWEDEILGDLKHRHSRSYSARFGLPPIERSVTLDGRSHDDVEKLKDDVYRVARRLRHPRGQTPVIEDQVPRMYQELQSILDSKVKSMRGSRRGRGGRAGTPPVLRHEEFVDYVRSLPQSVRQDNLEEDEEEYALACRCGSSPVGSLVATSSSSTDL